MKGTVTWGLVAILISLAFGSVKGGDEDDGDEDYTILIAALTTLGIIFIVFVYERLPNKGGFFVFKALTSESGVICIISIVLGLAWRNNSSFESFTSFNPDTFFEVFLPPIIFNAGYTLELNHGYYFFINMGTIFILAYVGTIISTAVIAMLCYLVTAQTDVVDLSLLAIVSAVDPVATIAVFEQMEVDPLLYNLVFGESVLNDAVAIVLYRTLTSFKDKSVILAGDIFRAIIEFIYVSVGSIALGLLLGILVTMVLKHYEFREFKEMETMLILSFAFASFHVAEAATLSGIMSVLFYGIFMAHYGYHSLTDYSKVSSIAISKILGFLAEGFVYALIGFSVFGVRTHEYNVLFIFSAFLFCLIGRAANTFPLAYVTNRGRKRKIPAETQFVIWFAGLRGAIAYGLALDVDTENSDLIETTTLYIVLITTIVMGGLTYPVLKVLGIETGASHDPSQASSGQATNKTRESKMWFNRWDNKYFKPWFRPEGTFVRTPAPNSTGHALQRVTSLPATELSNIAHVAAANTLQSVEIQEDRMPSVTEDSAPKGMQLNNSTSDVEIPNPLHSTPTDPKASQHNVKSDAKGKASRKGRFAHVQLEDEERGPSDGIVQDFKQGVNSQETPNPSSK